MRGETTLVRKLILIGIIAVLAILFVQPIRAYRTAQTELASTRAQLAEVREAKQRAIEERDALGTREMLVREARRRGYIFPGETPFSVATAGSVSGPTEGRWKGEGYQIVLSYADGRSERFVAFPTPDARDASKVGMLFFNGSMHLPKPR